MRLRHAIGTLGVAGALLVSLVAGVPAPVLAAAPAIRGEYRPGVVIVAFRPDLPAAARADARRAVGAVSQRSISPIAPDTEVLRLPEGADVARALATLSSRPGVRYAEPDAKVYLDASSNDPCYVADGDACGGMDLWGMYGDSTTPANEFGSQAGEAWAAGNTGSASVAVGIIDSGADPNHVDLVGNLWTNPYEIPGNEQDDDGNTYVDDVNGWDFWNGGGLPYTAAQSNHGTHVAGTIGGVGGNGLGVAGVNWDVTLIPAKVFGPYNYTYASLLIAATDYITDLQTRHPGLNIRVTNNSYGGPTFLQSQLDAINRGGDAGILFVAAAGNDATNSDAAPFYPADYICTTATRLWDCVVSVAAIDRDGSLAYFSNYGATSVDLGAPGVDIVSTWPGGYLASLSGTSMATPHVTGAVALCASITPSLGAPKIRDLLLGSTAATESLSDTTVTGGRLDIGTLAARCTTRQVTVTKAGSGTGTVTSNPTGISCGATCTTSYLGGTSVTLTATPAIGSVFTGWTGDCSSSQMTCTLSMDAGRTTTATFTLTNYRLTVTKSGTGAGTVTSNPSGISCGSSCSKSYPAGTSVTLTASRATGSVFTGWSGDCAGTGTTCTVAMNAAKSVTASFSSAATLTVSKASLSSGSGTVASSPTGISCGSTCSAPFAVGSAVTLTASPASGSIFLGWSANCTPVGDTNACTVAIDAAKTVTATFRGVRTLTVAKTGSGTVVSNPAGIDCGVACVFTYPYNTSVVLTATPADLYRFVSWTNCPSPSANTCTAAMSSNRSITANFTIITYALSVKKASVGSGAGTVTSTPTGIACGSTCSKSYAATTTVTLTATPGSGSVFVGWSTACTPVPNTLTCTVTMDAAKSVTATFGTMRTLTVARNNPAYGSVTSSPAGIACGSTCSFAYLYGTSVTLTAVPSSGRTFVSWSNCPSPSGSTCVISMTSARTVTANFA